MRYMGFGSYKTAWEMCHKIRVALMEDVEKLGGIVEVAGQRMTCRSRAGLDYGRPPMR
jgi:hypothetical protein